MSFDWTGKKTQMFCLSVSVVQGKNGAGKAFCSFGRLRQCLGKKETQTFTSRAGKI